MVDNLDEPPSNGAAAGAKRSLSVRQAAFIGVGSMVGAGIFALLGAAGEVAGSAVWISFLIAGGVAILQGYSFAKLGARYPSAGGFLEYVVRGWGEGHFTGVLAWLLLAVNAIITAMVAVSFGSYASAAVADNDDWTQLFAVLILIVMAALNVLGSHAVARAQTVVVIVVIGILVVFSVATLSNMDIDLLAFSGYPSWSQIVSSVALTFFAFLGFGVITFTAKDLADPARQLPRAIYLALGIATVVYVAVALGVFGTLTVDEVVSSGGTALAVAAEPVLGFGRLLADERHGAVRHRGSDELGALPRSGSRGRDGLGRAVPAGDGPPGRGPCPDGHPGHRGRGDGARDLLRPQRHRLDRQRGRAGGVHPRDVRAPPDPARDRCPAVAARPGRRHDRRRPHLVRRHHPRGRARHRRGAGRDPGPRDRARPRVEAPPGSAGPAPVRPHEARLGRPGGPPARRRVRR